MDAQFPPVPDDATRLQRMELIRQYVQATATADRVRLWRQLVTTLAPAEEVAALARIAAWFAGLPPVDLESSAAYTGYSDLLARALAGVIIPGSADYTEFEQHLAEWDDEYEDLRATIEEGYAAWSPQPATVERSAANLAEVALRRARAVWGTQLAYALEIVRVPGLARLQFPFVALIPQADMVPQHQIAGGEAGVRRDLVVRMIGPAPELGLPGRYQVTVQAQRQDQLNCLLQVNLRATELENEYQQILVTLGRAAQPDLSATLDEQGTVIFGPLPIEDLDGLTLTISLPTANG